jgi:hypothetical protein
LTPAGNELTRRFTAGNEHRYKELQDMVGKTFDRFVDPNDIKGSAELIARKLGPALTTRQRFMQTMTAGYYRSMGIAETGTVIEPMQLLDIAGTRLGGEPIAAGMDAIGPMMMEQIGNGASADKALEFGRYAFTRYADAEVRGAADREAANQSERPEVIGWEGIVSPDACDLCQENAGFHELDEEMYRHGNCGCERVPVYSGAAVEEAPAAEAPAEAPPEAGQTVELPDPAGAEGIAARAASYEGELTVAAPSDIAAAQADMKVMASELGPTWAESPGAVLTREALEGAGKGETVIIAQADNTVAGAILYEQRAAGVYSGQYGKVNMPELVHIHDVGSTGIAPNTGSTLTWSVFKEAQQKGLGVSLDPLEEAGEFWVKMGAQPDPWGAGTDMWGLTADTIKAMKL